MKDIIYTYIHIYKERDWRERERRAFCSSLLSPPCAKSSKLKFPTMTFTRQFSSTLVSCICVSYCQPITWWYRFIGRLGRAAARNALCCGFHSCWRLPGYAVDLGPKQSGLLLGDTTVLSAHHIIVSLRRLQPINPVKWKMLGTYFKLTCNGKVQIIVI